MLLDKFKEKYVTHQRALEQALDCLEKSSIKASPLAEQDKLRVKLSSEMGVLCLTQKETLKLLMETADINRFKVLAATHKPAESVIEYYYQKPLSECSLKEVMDGLVAVSHLANWFEEVNYTDDGDHYNMKIYHNMGINNSKIFLIFFESMFKTYGATARITISERSIFIKAYKKI